MDFSTIFFDIDFEQYVNSLFSEMKKGYIICFKQINMHTTILFILFEPLHRVSQAKNYTNPHSYQPIIFLILIIIQEFDLMQCHKLF